MQFVEGRVPEWVRRPIGLVDQARWLFCGAVVLSLLLTLPAPLSAGSGVSDLLAVVSSLVLCASWVLRYQRRGAALLLDIVDVVATLAFAAACPAPAAAFSFTFAALWMRALYGSTARIVLYCAGLAGAMAGSLLVWPLLPGHEGAVAAATVLGGLPVLFVTVVVARHLALALVAREQSRSRDAALVELSARLIGITEREVAYGLAWQASSRICESSPGLRIVVVRSDREDGLAQDHLRVVGTAGAFITVPEVLPAAMLPADAALTEVWPAQHTTGLNDAAGVVDGHWMGLGLPEQPQATMLIGAPKGVSPDALVAVQSMTNQVALALRTCEAHQDLATQAHTDSLTGLANRASFTSALESALTPGPSAPALLFLDLDDFKTVNDGLGHAAGDELLRHVAGRLRSAVRPEDLCARLGGDEFAILLPGASPFVAQAIAQRLVDSIAEPVTLRQGRARVAASVGVAVADPSMSAEQLVQRADVAMYAAKAHGKNRVQLFDPTLLQLDQQQVFKAELAAAAAAGQLLVHYQPIVSAQDGLCTAIEALVRWQHPVRGLLEPKEFISVAEQTGAIVDIGAVVLREACEFVASQARDHARLAMHVNVSAPQLLDAGFVEVVRDCLQRFSLGDKQLVLEITETMVLDSPKARATVSELVSLGAALAIDDFGTGYSALTTLRMLPLDIVKIDRSFIADCATNHADQAVVEAILQMAGRLGLQTVAEGVERLDQHQFLKRGGIGATQGFLHCQPLDAAAITAWLDAPTSRPALGSNVVTIAAPKRLTQGQLG